MKKIIFILLIQLFFLEKTHAQSGQDKVNSLQKSLSTYWENGDTDKAVETSLELYRISPVLFAHKIHDELAFKILHDPKHIGFTYLKQLYSKENQKINKMIEPVLFWSRITVTKDKNQLQLIKDELKELQKDSADYESKRELYCLLVLKELDKKKLADNSYCTAVLKKSIASLERYPCQSEVTKYVRNGDVRAWHRYLLAYCYGYLFSIAKNQEEYLKSAAYYSPDLYDRLNESAYFIAGKLLFYNARPVDYSVNYQKYLVANKRQDEALELLCAITFGDPTDHQLKSLKKYYAQLKKEEAFNTFWQNYINKKGKPVPQIKVQFDQEILDLSQKNNTWIYIDVWGTWCSPCRSELPELQTYYLNNLQNQHSGLKIYTFSYASKNLTEFMKDNAYSFPVAEIDKQFTEMFEIKEYPTKLLISPDGYYIKIPFGADWEMYVENYTLMRNE